MGPLFMQGLEDFFMNLFYDLLNISINAGWLVLAVLMLRLLLKKAPRWLVCSLWALVGIRLVFPFSIESVFSLIPSAETVPPTIMYEREPAIDSGISYVDRIINPIVAGSFTPDPMMSANPLQVWGFIASVIWLIGLVLMIGYLLFGYIRLRLRLRTATKREGNVYESEFVGSPFILGVFRPRIYLPYGLDEATFAHVIAHERAHLSRRDHLIKPLAFLILAVYWFQPLFWLAYVVLCRDIEYACDEKVIKNESEDMRRAYSMALLSCSIHRRAIAACPLAFGEVGVKDRVKNVMNYKKPAFWLVLAAVVAIIVTAVCFLTNPKNSNEKTEIYPPMYYAVEKIVERDGTSYFEAEHIPYFYIDKDMNLYEKRKTSMTGRIDESWRLCGVLEKVEGAREETWSLSCNDEFGNLSQKTFSFYKNGDVEYTYADGKGGVCISRMQAVPDMTKQLNVLSVQNLRSDVVVSHEGTVHFNGGASRSDPHADIQLKLGFKNNMETSLYTVGEVQMEKRSELGWVSVDFMHLPWAHLSSGQGLVQGYQVRDEMYGVGIYRMTVFVEIKETNDIRTKVPCAEILFEIVNPGGTINVATDMP